MPQFAAQKETWQAMFGPKCCDGLKVTDNMCKGGGGTLKSDLANIAATGECKDTTGKKVEDEKGDNIDEAGCKKADDESTGDITFGWKTTSCSMMNAYMGSEKFIKGVAAGTEDKPMIEGMVGPKCCDGFTPPAQPCIDELAEIKTKKCMDTDATCGSTCKPLLSAMVKACAKDTKHAEIHSGSSKSLAKCNSKKPKFTQTEKAKHVEKKKTFTVAKKIADKTRAPTKAPTKSPTKVGMKFVKRKQKRKAAKAKLSFPLTAEEAKNPVMQDALTAGVAKSLGKDPADVKIISIDGVAVSRRRLGDSEIEFEIISSSNDAADADQLTADLEAAATGGSIVANVQEAANDKGVLVQALQDMPLEMVKPTVVVAEKEVEVEVEEKDPTPPTPSPSFSAASTSAASTVTAVASAVMVAVLMM